MARKQIYDVALLRSGRAVRILPLDAKRTLELQKRVGRHLPPIKPGEKMPEINQSEIGVITQKSMIAMTVKGITREPVEVKFKKRPPTADETASFAAAGKDAPAEMDDGVDLEATLRPYTDKASPEFKRWTDLGEMQLENESEEDDNELGMFVLFKAPSEWKSLLELISAASGDSSGENPFGVRTLKTSAG